MSAVNSRRSYSREDTFALALGLASCGANWIMAMFETSPYLPLGYFFLSLGAICFGIRGLLLGSIFAFTGDLFWRQDYSLVLEVFGSCFALSIFSFQSPRWPPFLVTTGYWFIGLVPLYLSLSMIGVKFPEDTLIRLSTAGAAQVFTSLVAGALLLNDTMWFWMHNRPRLFSLNSLLIHTSCLMSVAATLFAMSSPATISPLWCLSLAFFGVGFPALVAFRLTAIVHRGVRDSLSHGLASHPANRGFSGLSSTYWRRKLSVPTEEQVDTSDANREPSQSGLTQTHIRGGPIAPDMGICSVDGLGTISFVNRKFLKLAGVTEREVLGKKIDSVSMHKEIAMHLLQTLGRHKDFGPQISELKVNELPSSLRYFEIRTLNADMLEGSSIADAPENTICTLRDITGRRAIESSLLRAHKLSSLGSFVSGVGHAFNNALTAIVGHASFARQVNDPAQVQNSLDQIVQASCRAGELVHQVLDYADSVPGEPKSCDLKKFLDDRAGLMRELVGDGMTLDVRTGTDAVGVRCDPHLIMQALTNLVLNAKEAYPEKTGDIQVSIDVEEIDTEMSSLHAGVRPGRFARMRVKDNGFGMPPEVVEKAFEPLFTTKGSKGRTGLGLSTVYAIVRAHDGFLTVESHPGKGTTVSVYLPLYDLQHDSKSRHAAASSAQVTPHHQRILVVEDEKNVRELVTSMLASLGYAVTSCAEPQEALTQCRSTSFDLVLVDMAMPNMDGSELIRRLQELNSSARALIMTGYGAGGADGTCNTPILAKPFDMNTLSNAVETALHNEDKTT